MINLLTKIMDDIKSCIGQVFKNPESIYYKIITSADSKRYPAVVPYQNDKNKYKNHNDFQLIVGGTYHYIGDNPVPYNLNFYFRHFLFSSNIYHIINAIKSKNGAIKLTPLDQFFENDTQYEKFYNYVMNENNRSIQILKQLAIIYQQLKIYEEKNPREIELLEIPLNYLAFLICSLVFIICKSLNDNDLLKIPNIEEDVDIDAEYSKTFNIFQLVPENCKQIFHETDSKLNRVLELFLQSYNFNGAESPF